MDEREYEHLILGAEGEAASDPHTFRTKVVLLSAAAYIALAATLLTLGALLYVGTVHLLPGRNVIHLLGFGMIALSILPIFFLVLRMFLLRLPPPEGRPLSAEQAPTLFKWLDNIRRQVGGPALHRVLLTRDFNAAICQVPRWGLFGGHRNYLMLGLPLMQALGPKEMEAVIAHEYGHLSGNHGKLNAWIYRQRRVFGALAEYADSHAENGGGSVNDTLGRAIRWFAPYFNAYTFVLSRRHEYEADAVANRVSGAAHNASSLIRGDLIGRWLHEDFWPKLYAQAQTRNEPAFLPYTAMPTAFVASYDQWATKARLQAAWKTDSDLHDTHPCLRERIEAMDIGSALPPAVTRSSAEALLGPLAKQIAREFDRDWWQEAQANWQQHHRQTRRSAERHDVLATQPTDNLGVPELQELALLQANRGEREAARKTLTTLFDKHGRHYSKPLYLYGCLLLEDNDDSGLDHLAEALALSPSFANDCAHTGYNYLCRKYAEQEADAWIERIERLLGQERGT